VPSALQNPTPHSSRHRVTVRRIAGAIADELHLLARPGDPSAGAQAQAESAYEALVSALGTHGARADDLVTENVLLRPDAADFTRTLAARHRVLERAGVATAVPATTFIGQAPLEGDGSRLLIAARAVLPRQGVSLASSAVHCAAPCGCEVCSAGLHGRVIRLGDRTHLHAGNAFGRGEDAAAEAFDMFCEAERLLQAAGMEFTDVIRTWVHLRDIDRDYAALNRARRDFFASRGIERRPASTGVQGIPFASAHDFSLSLLAVKSRQPLDVALMSTPTLNEAWTYGADFSRGLRLDDGNSTSLIVSGTASVDQNGLSVHAGDLAGQVARMLLNIEMLLDEQGARLGDLVSAVTYVKHASDAPPLRRLYEQRGFGAFPLAIVEAPLCRPELLCETEAVAVLPSKASR